MPDPVTAHVRLTRLIRAPREQVFEAWLDSEVRKQWWRATPEMHCPLAEIDPTPGGRYRMAMCKDENESVAFGEFVEIDRPERLVFTWSWEHDLDFGGGSRVTVTLHDTTFDGQPATEPGSFTRATQDRPRTLGTHRRLARRPPGPRHDPCPSRNPRRCSGMRRFKSLKHPVRVQKSRVHGGSKTKPQRRGERPPGVF